MTAATSDAARAVLVSDWWAAFDRGGDALMIAHRRADVADLNALARERLRAHGRLGRDCLTTQRTGFAVGDRVVTTRNNARLGVVNGQAGTLTAVGADGVTLATDAGARIELPRAYVQAGHLAHGYAITAHRAQGATVDRTFVLGSNEIYLEWGYTAMSRHREEARFYVTASPRFLNERAVQPVTGIDAGALVSAQLGKSRAQNLACDPLRSADEQARRRSSGRELG